MCFSAYRKISAEAAAVTQALKIREFVKATSNDYKHTISLLKNAGVTKAFNFKF